MNKTTKLTTKIIKTDEGHFVHENLLKLNKLLDDLEPGIYDYIMVKKPERLARLKRYYFAMETYLAQHLGIKKVDLHRELKPRFTKFNEQEEEVYESIADIDSEEDMMQRIYEFQVYAVTEHKYTMEPYQDD